MSEENGWPQMRRWMGALRSGQFAQTGSWLARVGAEGQMSYCCLGVACELAVADDIGVRRWGADISGHVIYGTSSMDSSSTCLPDSVMRWLDLSDLTLVRSEVDPYGEPKLYLPPDLVTIATTMDDAGILFDDGEGLWSAPSRLNDGFRFTFAQIADCIEYTYFRAEWEARNGAQADS